MSVDTWPVIIDSQKITLRKGETSPERWELDFGTIPPQRNFFEGPPFSAVLLTEVRLDLDPPALVADCEGLMLNYWFELALNGRALKNGPSYEVTNTYVMAMPQSIQPSIGQHAIGLRFGDRLSGLLFLGTRASLEDDEPPRPGVPFVATADFSFQITLLGFATDSEEKGVPPCFV